MADKAQPQLTLFIWIRGMFPRRIVYQLLIKGLVASPADMLVGKTSVDSLRLNIATLTPNGFVEGDPADPKPAGNSSPCLRITDQLTGSQRWIHESSAIATYLDDAFPNLLSLQSEDIVERAMTADLVYQINLIGNDCSYYIRHAAAAACVWSGMANEDRSIAAATNARSQMARGFLKVQSWAQISLQTTGWLTPGINRPGLADISLAAMARYLQLVYEIDFFDDDDELRPLREWWQRFKAVSWWNEMEEEGVVHPPEFVYGKKALDI